MNRILARDRQRGRQRDPGLDSTTTGSRLCEESTFHAALHQYNLLTKMRGLPSVSNVIVLGHGLNTQSRPQGVDTLQLICPRGVIIDDSPGIVQRDILYCLRPVALHEIYELNCAWCQ